MGELNRVDLDGATPDTTPVERNAARATLEQTARRLDALEDLPLVLQVAGLAA